MSMPKPSLNLSDSNVDYAAHQKVINQPEVVKLKRDYACACVFKKQILDDSFWFKDGVDVDGDLEVGEGIGKCWIIFRHFDNEAANFDEADWIKPVSVARLTATLRTLYILLKHIGQTSTYLKAPEQFMMHSVLMRRNHQFAFKSVFQTQLAHYADQVDQLIQECSPLHNNRQWFSILAQALEICEKLGFSSQNYIQAVTNLMQQSFQEINKYEKIIDVEKKNQGYSSLYAIS